MVSRLGMEGLLVPVLELGEEDDTHKEDLVV
jgi:hypothetical protein